MIDNFYESLSSNDEAKREAQAYFLKQSSTAQVASAAAKGFMGSNSSRIVAGLAGAGLAAGFQYMQARKGPTGTSFEQGLARRSVEALEESAERKRALGQDTGFTHDLTMATAKGARNFAEVLAKHPVRGALLAAPFGASAGLLALKALKSGVGVR